ncbi:MAG TPA: hypothetical protein EYO58_07510 [Flavobacteriales bacterium]|nr:hypothetical protein [Flavobacteriales bacterium]
MIHTEYNDALKNVVNKTFALDIMNKTRRRKYVDARMTFAYILMKEGATLEAVARYLGMNHASIYYYKSRFPWIVKHDSVLKERYEHIMKVHQPRPETPDVYFFSKYELIQEVLALREKLDDLNCEKDKLLSDQQKDKTLAPLYKVVKDRTRTGSETDTKRRLVQFFNGLN